jgi:hypothetical protein
MSRLRTWLRHADAFLVLSRFICDLRRRHFPGQPLRHQPPFASDVTESEGSPALDWLPQHPFALYVGRLELLKEVQTLLPLCVPADGSTPLLDYVLVGQCSLAPVIRLL